MIPLFVSLYIPYELRKDTTDDEQRCSSGDVYMCALTFHSQALLISLHGELRKRRC